MYKVRFDSGKIFHKNELIMYFLLRDFKYTTLVKNPLVWIIQAQEIRYLLVF